MREVMRGRVLVSLVAVCLGWGAGLAGARGGDLGRDVARAEAIFTVSYDRDRDPQLRVEQVLFCVDPPLGQMALAQGMETFRDRCGQISSQGASGMEHHLVFARMPKGDVFLPAPFAMVTAYLLNDGRFFYIARKEHSLEDVLRLIEERKRAGGA